MLYSASRTFNFNYSCDYIERQENTVWSYESKYINDEWVKLEKRILLVSEFILKSSLSKLKLMINILIIKIQSK